MQAILEQLKLKADVVNSETNGVMSRYFVRLRPGGTVKKIENRASEIALGLKSYSIPLVKLIPEDGLVSLEMITDQVQDVPFEHLMDNLHASKHDLPVIVGQEYSGEPLIADLTKTPHMLIAGTTGSGKSVLLHSILCSLIMQQNADVKLALIDPKNVEFSFYNDIKQLLYPVVNYADDALDVLSDLVEEMDKRFQLMAKASVNSIQAYNAKKKKKLPYIVLVIDEFSDLMQRSKKVFQEQLGRLAQKSRACGIHIIIATQRPSADVVTGIVKANCPTVVSFRVTSITNSRVVLDHTGAEKLLGKGDGLIHSSSYNMTRFKGAFLDETQINAICQANQRSRWSKFINYIRNV